jgi:hypothetical protein
MVAMGSYRDFAARLAREAGSFLKGGIAFRVGPHGRRLRRLRDHRLQRGCGISGRDSPGQSATVRRIGVFHPVSDKFLQRPYQGMLPRGVHQARRNGPFDARMDLRGAHKQIAGKRHIRPRMLPQGDEFQEYNDILGL